MRFLLVLKQKKNADAFLETMGALAARGHSVTVAVQDSDDKRDERLTAAAAQTGLTIIRCPSARIDEWSGIASLVRRLRDSVHYLQPALQSAAKLRARAIQRLRQDVQIDIDTPALANGLQSIPPDHVQRLDTVFALAEQSLPTDPLFDEFLGTERPDVLLVSPLVHFGPAQADLVASARRLRIPVWMLLYSWDNLSTKGCLHRFPDRIFAWNEEQRREAKALHSFPPDRVVVVGAPRFDGFFALRPLLTREAFHEPLGLDAARATLLYVCSSRFVSEHELPFIQRWLGALRQSTSAALRDCNVLVRPHPDIPLLPADLRMTRHRWPDAPDLAAKIARPFDDDRAVVLQTDFAHPQGLYESITHSTAVVGLNTTAELEAAIVGRPVFTIVADDPDVDGQSSTLHFHYLTKERGGIVSMAATLADHIAQLGDALSRPADPAPIRTFVESFLRPLGMDNPVAPLFAETLERTAMASTDASATAETVSAGSAPDLEAASPLKRGDHRTVAALACDGVPPLHVYVTPTVERVATASGVPVDQSTIDWLNQEVRVGDVVYDVGAGIGEYVLVAARRRGAVVVAFEPGYAVFGQLCDNVLLNGCEATVVPVPIALAARDALAEIKYIQGQPGELGYAVRDDVEWRVKHRGKNKPYLQPACLARLDTVVEQYRLPSPHHLRISPLMSADAVLAGATATLALPTLRTLCLGAHAKEAAERFRPASARYTVTSVGPPEGGHDVRPQPLA